MGLHDRPYMKEPPVYRDGGGFGGGGLMVGMPKASPMVKLLLLINLAMFVIQMFADRPTGRYPFGLISSYFGVTAAAWWQVWRYITFQFIHGGIWHIGMNMLGLYMLGSPLEQRLGSRRFLRFYLGCGVVAGIAYAAMGQLVGASLDVPIVGASGGVYAVVLAVAVFFPQFKIILVLFPVPIRFACLLIFGFMIVTVLTGLVGRGDVTPDFWSNVAHLGGAVAAAVYIWVLPKLTGGLSDTRARLGQGAWRRKQQRRAREEAETDRILEKIRRQGLNSLNSKEKKTLRDATRKQARDDNNLYR